MQGSEYGGSRSALKSSHTGTPDHTLLSTTPASPGSNSQTNKPHRMSLPSTPSPIYSPRGKHSESIHQDPTLHTKEKDADQCVIPYPQGGYNPWDQRTVMELSSKPGKENMEMQALNPWGRVDTSCVSVRASSRRKSSSIVHTCPSSKAASP